ncbi:MAG: SDR family NAD(P)-dependent oxidoreductase, partial [Bacteroidota bacterium]|nr:SDR family NAD(P)-dependent oxidoreductase [Bacteroidota bacterium]
MKKTILLTGATSGIGRAATIEFYKQGHEIIIPARNKQKVDDLISAVNEKGDGKIKYYECNLASQKSLKEFVQNVKNDYSKIDVLVNNAGVWNKKIKITEEDIEETFAVNIYASYYLTQEFLPLIELGEDKRIIYTSSGLHGGKIHFDDIQFRKKYSNFLVYQQSKLALILLTKYFAQKLEEKKITVNCLHPGMVNT